MHEKPRLANVKRLFVFGTGVAAILGVSCGALRTTTCPYTLSEHYKTADLSHQSQIVVFPNDKMIVVNNKKDVVDVYGGLNASPESRIRKFYFPEMLSTIKALISGDSITDLGHCRPDLSWDSLGTTIVTLKTGSDSIPMQYAVPRKARMQALGLDSTTVIIVESIAFKRNNFHCEYYWDDKSRVPANLEVAANVMIWDFVKDMPVFFGPVSTKVEFTFGLQRKHWDQSAYSLAKKIVLAAKCL
jgi:hypothetical protein